jgi:translation initiation factor IF-2
MQPRRLRLGDVVDDYCSRCRLLSNHAIAAIVDDAIKQTRCSTCDFEHPYKDGKLPVRRTKKDGTSALYKQVLDNVTDGAPDDQPSAVAKPAAPIRPALARPDAPRPVPVIPDTPAIDTPAAAAAPPPAPPALPPVGVPAPTLVRPAAAAPPAPMAPPLAAAPAEPVEPRDDAGEAIVHRRLIRATLPRVEGAEREARPIPVFTVHEAANARGKFRRFPRPSGGFGNGNGGNANGNAMPRFGHGGQPSPFSTQGRGPGKGGGQQPNRGGGGQHGNRNQQQRRGNKGR